MRVRVRVPIEARLVAAAIEQLEQGSADVHHLGDAGEIWGRYGGDRGEI